MKPNRRRWLFRLAAMVLPPLLLLGGLEIALRIAGFGYSTNFFIPAPEGGGALIENGSFGARFFPPALVRGPLPMKISRAKAANAVRIFTFGGSATKGEPEPAFGFARILEVLLEGRYPPRDFEIVNVAVTAINSHAILPIAREVTALDGDVWVIYMGNNEVLGPFGAGSIFGARASNLTLLRASLALKKLRIAQLLERLAAALGAGRESPEAWQGMEMFLEQQFRRDDARLENVYEYFDRNLRDIVDAGAGAGVKMILATVASNLKDCAPFASLHAPGLGEAELKEWEALHRQGADLEAAGNHAGALAAFSKAAEIDASHAELEFRIARCQLALGQVDLARRHFLLARDLDTIRFRADTRINDIIRKVAAASAARGAQLADAEGYFLENSPQGIPGQEAFYEHVHYTFEGNYRLARLLAEKVAAALALAPPGRDPGWLEPEEVAARLALTSEELGRVSRLVWNRLNKPPYNGQLNHPDRSRELRRQIAAYQAASNAAGFDRQAEIYRRAIQGSPRDWVLHDLFGSFLTTWKRDREAEAEFLRVLESLPHHYVIRYKLGMVLQFQGRLDEAEQSFREALRLKPGFYEAHQGLGTILAGQGKHGEACGEFEEALAARPDDSECLSSLGASLEAQGRSQEAIARYRRAVEVQPSNDPARLRLGALLLQTGTAGEAADHFAQVVARQPRNVEARIGLASALLEQSEPEKAVQHLAEALRLDPGNEDAARRYREAVERLGGPDRKSGSGAIRN